MLRYAITDRILLCGGEAEVRATPAAQEPATPATRGALTAPEREALVAQAARLARDGMDYLQVREKDLSESETVSLVRAMMAAIRAAGGTTKLLLNGTPALAQWAGADGVHLSSTSFSQNLQTHHGLIVTVSCHTIADVRRAYEFADLVLFGPVFEKRVGDEIVVQGVGLDRLREACAAAGEMPVLALGGVEERNAQACMDAGAAGVAGIRLFHR